MSNKKNLDCYKKIAKKYSISEEEVRCEIENTIEIAMKNENPTIKKIWKDISSNKKKPSVEEVILYLIYKLNNDESNKK